MAHRTVFQAKCRLYVAGVEPDAKSSASVEISSLNNMNGDRDGLKGEEWVEFEAGAFRARAELGIVCGEECDGTQMRLHGEITNTANKSSAYSSRTISILEAGPADLEVQLRDRANGAELNLVCQDITVKKPCETPYASLAPACNKGGTKKK